MNNPTLDFFDYAAAIVSVTALFAYANHRWLRLPTSLGVMTISIVAATSILILDSLGVPLLAVASRFVDAIDFDRALMHGALSLLLFAGALQFDFDDLVRQRWTILSLSSIGTLLAAALTGLGCWALLNAAGIGIDIVQAMLLGAIIAPTDAVAAIMALRNSRSDPAFAATVSGESMFNDPAALVLFLLLYEAEFVPGTFAVGDAVGIVVFQVCGGILLGAILGQLGRHVRRHVRDSRVQILATLAIVMGGYDLSTWIDTSGPLAMVTAGLLLNRDFKRVESTSAAPPHDLSLFWEVMDEILNACLFALIGLELIALRPDPRLLILAIAMLPVSLIARYASVRMCLEPMTADAHRQAVALTWAGIRGGVSVALALGLPDSPLREQIVHVVYVSVLFSVLAQGVTLKWVLHKLGYVAT